VRLEIFGALRHVWKRVEMEAWDARDYFHEMLHVRLEYMRNRPTQSMIYCHCLIAWFQEIIITYRSVQKLLNGYKSVLEDEMLEDLILRTRLCSTNFITQHGWVILFRLTKMVRRKCVVPNKYQLPRGLDVSQHVSLLVSACTVLRYFCMIHMGRRL